MALWQWSRTATSNANIDPTMNWAEGIPPSIVDDNVRALMARVAEWRDDNSGALVTAGTAPNYTLATFEILQSPTPVTGSTITIFMNSTNVGSDLLACDSGSAYPIQSPAGTAISAGVMVAGTPYSLYFNGTAWILKQIVGLPFVVPVGAMIDWTGSAAPNSNFVLPFGQAISRTTYSTYNAILSALSYPYGAGDGSTTFNVIDLRGRITAGVDNMGGSAAGRIGTLATDGGTIVGTTLGSVGGSQNHVQTGSELASHNHTGSGNTSEPGHQHAQQSDTVLGEIGGGSLGGATGLNQGGTTQVANASVSVPSLNINFAGGSAAMALLQPTIMCNKILRVI